MTDPVCEVVERDPIRSRYPLATRSGVHALVALLAANSHWRPVSPRGKQALRTAYRGALATAQPGDRIPMPLLPADTHRATVHMLVRRGLAAHATVDGTSTARLTPLAVEVLAWALLGEPRPVETLSPVGGRL